MPNITLYLDTDTFILFEQLPPEIQNKVRNKAKAALISELSKPRKPPHG